MAPRKLGSSSLHTDSSNRGRLSLDQFREPPSAAIAVPALSAEAAAACQGTAQAICARDTPVVVRGSGSSVLCTDRWSSAERLCEAYGEVPFEVAADVTLTMREYVEYAAEAEADYPYYLVERRFEGPRAALLQDYAQPSLFADDLLASVPGSKRARYWLVGGERSGTALHVDPLCSAAWNYCACGRKLWAFLPPDTTPLQQAGLRTRAQGGERRPAVWFRDELEAAASLPGYQLCLQQAGDLLYIPSGWHHAVLNLEFSVAISQAPDSAQNIRHRHHQPSSPLSLSYALPCAELHRCRRPRLHLASSLR